MEPRDIWSKAEITAQVISAIFLPVALLFVGRIYDHREQERQQLEDNANRLTALIDHLSSDVPRERKLAITVTNYLANQGQLPEELVPVVTLVAIADEDQQVADSARETLTTAAQQQPELTTTIVQAARPTSNVDVNIRPAESEVERQAAAAQIVAEVVAPSSLTPLAAESPAAPTVEEDPAPPAANILRIAYIQYRSDLKKAEQLRNYLETQGISVPDIEQIANIETNDIRYSNSNEQNLAEQLKAKIKTNQGVEIDQLLDLSKSGYEAPSGQVEIWLKD
ncbi:MAG: hypothetical protein AAGA83_02165 [Cyanobacteria bacterium P01_F01_bin.116]